MRGRLSRACAGGLVVLALSACASIPRDPDGTLDRVREQGVLRVGASPSGELVAYAGDDVIGREVELVEGFAAELGARVDWTLAGETALVAMMERGELDVIIGGLHTDSPWADTVSITRAYAESTEAGETVKHALAVPLGENAMLVRLERYLDEATP
jgi:ABC-type amino acid transport substrate-binding protein